jgi:hypothetical protein
MESIQTRTLSVVGLSMEETQKDIYKYINIINSFIIICDIIKFNNKEYIIEYNNNNFIINNIDDSYKINLIKYFDNKINSTLYNTNYFIDIILNEDNYDEEKYEEEKEYEEETEYEENAPTNRIVVRQKSSPDNGENKRFIEPEIIPKAKKNIKKMIKSGLSILPNYITNSIKINNYEIQLLYLDIIIKLYLINYYINLIDSPLIPKIFDYNFTVRSNNIDIRISNNKSYITDLLSINNILFDRVDIINHDAILKDKLMFKITYTNIANDQIKFKFNDDYNKKQCLNTGSFDNINYKQKNQYGYNNFIFEDKTLNLFAFLSELVYRSEDIISEIINEISSDDLFYINGYEIDRDYHLYTYINVSKPESSSSTSSSESIPESETLSDSSLSISLSESTPESSLKISCKYPHYKIYAFLHKIENNYKLYIGFPGSHTGNDWDVDYEIIGNDSRIILSNYVIKYFLIRLNNILNDTIIFIKNKLNTDIEIENIQIYSFGHSLGGLRALLLSYFSLFNPIIHNINMNSNIKFKKYIIPYVFNPFTGNQLLGNFLIKIPIGYIIYNIYDPVLSSLLNSALFKTNHTLTFIKVPTMIYNKLTQNCIREILDYAHSLHVYIGYIAFLYIYLKRSKYYNINNDNIHELNLLSKISSLDGIVIEPIDIKPITLSKRVSPRSELLTSEEVLTEEVLTEEVLTEEVLTEEVLTEEVLTEEVLTSEKIHIISAGIIKQINKLLFAIVIISNYIANSFNNNLSSDHDLNIILDKPTYSTIINSISFNKINDIKQEDLSSFQINSAIKYLLDNFNSIDVDIKLLYYHRNNIASDIINNKISDYNIFFKISYYINELINYIFFMYKNLSYIIKNLVYTSDTSEEAINIINKLAELSNDTMSSIFNNYLILYNDLNDSIKEINKHIKLIINMEYILKEIYIITYSLDLSSDENEHLYSEFNNILKFSEDILNRLLSIVHNESQITEEIISDAPSTAHPTNESIVIEENISDTHPAINNESQQQGMRLISTLSITDLDRCIDGLIQKTSSLKDWLSGEINIDELTLILNSIKLVFEHFQIEKISKSKIDILNESIETITHTKDKILETMTIHKFKEYIKNDFENKLSNKIYINILISIISRYICLHMIEINNSAEFIKHTITSTINNDLRKLDVLEELNVLELSDIFINYHECEHIKYLPREYGNFKSNYSTSFKKINNKIIMFIINIQIDLQYFNDIETYFNNIIKDRSITIYKKYFELDHIYTLIRSEIPSNEPELSIHIIDQLNEKINNNNNLSRDIFASLCGQLGLTDQNIKKYIRENILS